MPRPCLSGDLLRDDGEARQGAGTESGRQRPQRLQRVCTENSILINYVTESPNVSGDDRAALFLPGPVRHALQVEEPTGGRERCAPPSTDCAATEGAGSRPTHKWGSFVPGPAVSMVSIGSQGYHDHPARDPRALASGGFPPVLALEIPLPWRPTEDHRGSARVDLADERVKSVVGSATHPW
jgi:hypothetical protein